ncbi:MAG: RNA polymerase sigma factor [Flavobacteriales bacterium]|nr:RNA polymerase sigma factor [Flavobacteriales bacterium]
MELKEKLIKDVVKGKRKAQLELYSLCFNLLMSVASRYKNNKEDAAFLANDAFLKIINNLKKYDKETPFEAWIRRITINVVIDDYRKNKKRIEMFESVGEFNNDTEDVSFNEIDKEMEEEEVLRCLLKLPPATRTVFSLFAIDGFSHKEICEKLGISLETSKWHMKEARKRLKIILEKELI